MDFLDKALQTAPFLVIGLAGVAYVARLFLKHMHEETEARRTWSETRHREFFAVIESAAARSDETIDNNTKVMGAVLERLREER